MYDQKYTVVRSELRMEELARLEVSDLEEREGRCVIPELVGKGQRVRLVPVPGWGKDALDAWTAAAGIAEGRLFRSIRKGALLDGAGADIDRSDADGEQSSDSDGSGQLPKEDRRLGASLSVKAIWQIVLEHAKEIGVERLGPHDLRRTCARLCNDSGGDLVQIQMLLGRSHTALHRRWAEDQKRRQ